MKKRRMGKFYLEHFFIDAPESLAGKMLARMEFVPWRVEYLAHMDRFEYIGTSPRFALVDKGNAVPQYIVSPYERDGEVYARVE